MHKILTALALGLLVLNVALAADDKGQNDKKANQDERDHYSART